MVLGMRVGGAPSSGFYRAPFPDGVVPAESLLHLHPGTEYQARTMVLSTDYFIDKRVQKVMRHRFIPLDWNSL